MVKRAVFPLVLAAGCVEVRVEKVQVGPDRWPRWGPVESQPADIQTPDEILQEVFDSWCLP